MAKVMLVEDDNNLREIYEARLLAEGYDIVSAQDGEEALALAVKEKPDLIIADIMMPKISGFDMLDILRSTPETKDTKVVMMTALSQAEDKDRANKLGADRYLVKSQVTLEDVARVAREVLDGKSPDHSGGDGAPSPGPGPSDPPTPPPPATPTMPIAVAAPPQAPVVDTSGPTAPPPASVDDPKGDNNAVLAGALSSIGGNNPGPAVGSATDGQKTAVHTKVIQPINDLSQTGPNIQDLVAKEEAKEAAANGSAATSSAVVAEVGKPSSTPSAGGADPNSIAL